LSLSREYVTNAVWWTICWANDDQASSLSFWSGEPNLGSSQQANWPWPEHHTMHLFGVWLNSLSQSMTHIFPMRVQDSYNL
jgi:hypothetical protein